MNKKTQGQYLHTAPSDFDGNLNDFLSALKLKKGKE
jgi:hypothetical protein